MIKEHSVVSLIRDYEHPEGFTIPENSYGTVVHRWGPYNIFLVEFVYPEHCVLEVYGDDLYVDYEYEANQKNTEKNHPDGIGWDNMGPYQN